MKRIALALMTICLTTFLLGNTPDAPTLRAKAQQLQKDGNYKESFALFERLAKSGSATANDITQAVSNLHRLNRVDDVDTFREMAATKNSGNWRVLQAVANSYANDSYHYGHMVSGKFQRGQKRGGSGKVMNAYERDRVRAWQLLEQALPLVEKDKSRSSFNVMSPSGFYHSFSQIIMGNRGYSNAWRLQYKTNLNELPDYEEGWGYNYQNRYGRQSQNYAPVDEDGSPVYHTIPKSFESAETDGQRWRYLLMLRSELGERNQVTREYADFLFNQFGVQSMASYNWFSSLSSDNDDKDRQGGILQLHTLTDSETVARLATGVKRFKLPTQHNYMHLYKTLGNSDFNAINRMREIYTNRRQYAKAAEVLKTIIANFSGQQKINAQDQLNQIVGNWGLFEGGHPQPSGQGAQVHYRFRNGKKVTFTAHEINVDRLLSDVKRYIKGNPRRLDWKQTNLGDIGRRLVWENQTKYVEKEIASWSLNLTPRPNHFDKRLTVTTPLQKAGAYLLTAHMDDGNTTRIVVWVSDTAIVRKVVNGKSMYYAADAVTGKELPDVTLDFFGYWQEYVGNKITRKLVGRHYTIHTKTFKKTTNSDGLAYLDSKEIQIKKHNANWLIIARKGERMAYYGFSGIWGNRLYESVYNQRKTFVITDRPVYRPGQTVKFKVWTSQAHYEKDDLSQYAGRSFAVRINDPKGQKAFEKQYKADTFGGFNGDFVIPNDATLGSYYMSLPQWGGGLQFRIEEYKKPEFEVKVNAPTEPVMLGETIPVTIQATYFFGAPVTKAKVKLTVLRYNHDSRWFPAGRWDWFYGPGYWWFAYDYNWYPGWKNWGCRAPAYWWWPRQQTPPEVVIRKEAYINPDGTVNIDIDTRVAKELHGDTDHKYEITAEVTDESRRVIVGKGNVLVAREPFKVYTWIDRGYYMVGDKIHASMSARTVDGKGVKGAGELKLLKLTYDKQGTPIETPINTWKINTADDGLANHDLLASEPGQYRISYSVTDDAKHTIEGGYIFVVRGTSFDGNDFQFSKIELVPDKRDYKPGDTMKLMINVDRRDATVLLFLRPISGVYREPKVIRMKGKSAIEEVLITKKDMPNFFIEAVTLYDGKLHSTNKEIVVPPEKRILDLTVKPSKTEYKPGEKAKMKILLKDFYGEPFVGSVVMSIYDKAVEYISGGSNIPEIKAFFWKWRRRHNPQQWTSLDKYFNQLLKPKEKGMGFLGVFGQSVADMTVESSSRGRVSRNGGVKYKSGAKSDIMMAKPSMAPTKSMGMADSAVEMEEGRAAGVGGGERAPQPVFKEAAVRTKFADTAYWNGTITTDKTGHAEIEFTMPENLTGWKVRSWALGKGPRVGESTVEVVTKKNLMLRLQAPRFFVQKDEVILSANVHNYLKTEKTVRVVLETNNILKIMKSDVVFYDSSVPLLGDLPLIKRLFQSDAEKNTKKGLLMFVSPRIIDPKGIPLRDHDIKGLPDFRSSNTPKNKNIPVWDGESVVLGGTITDEIIKTKKMQRHTQIITIPANGEQRVDWRVLVKKEGQALVRMKALTDEESDAMEMTFPAKVHGFLKTESFSGHMRPEENGSAITFTVPKERRPEDSRIEVRYSPTLAGAMVDALPYMVSYPYGCTEQTLNRFLPTVITHKILQDMGVNFDEIRKKRTNLNAQEIGDDTERAEQWKNKGNKIARLDKDGKPVWNDNPVFDEALVRDMIKVGITRLTNMQLSDGGWGWFSGWGEHSSAHTTATVVHGLQMARAYNANVPDAVLKRGIDWLTRYQQGEVAKIKNKKHWKNHADNFDALVFMILIDADSRNRDMEGFLYRDRTRISVYGNCMIALAYQKLGLKQETAMLQRNIEQYLVMDKENQTAHLKLGNSGYWWYWYGSEFEAHAYYLKLLAKREPKSNKASWLVKYLLNNRKHATYWNSTRDTALCIEALADYMRASGENKPDMTLEVLLDGKVHKEVQINNDNMFAFDNKLILTGKDVTSGTHKLEFRRTGKGPLYYNTYVTYFSLEDFITKAGLEIKVNRKYFKLLPAAKSIKVTGSRGQALDQKVKKYKRVELKNLDEVTSGDLLEIELSIESKNDYEYILFEDLKAAGCEPYRVRSGYTRNGLPAYMELRDDTVCFFVRNLARGKHSIAYRMRAEIPGKFSALPTRAYAMYAPELRGNSDEFKLRIKELELKKE